MTTRYLLRSADDIRTGSGLPADVRRGWAAGPFYSPDELAFTRDFEVKEWDFSTVQSEWRDHSAAGTEYISVTNGTLTAVIGELTKPGADPTELERVKVPAGNSVILIPGLWRRFEATADAKGITVRGTHKRDATAL
jgi:hypothetical protein